MPTDASASLLRLTQLRKAFDAVVATNGVDLDVRAGEIHAIIGPNGAGKSTLIAQICGEIRPDSGTIHLDGQDVTWLRAFERARLGLGRSFQITELCQEVRIHALHLVDAFEIDDFIVHAPLGLKVRPHTRHTRHDTQHTTHATHVSMSVCDHVWKQPDGHDPLLRVLDYVQTNYATYPQSSS